MKTINENYFKNDKDTSSKNIQDYIDANEQILWQGKPNKASFILSSIFRMLPVALLWGFFDGFMIAKLIAIPHEYSVAQIIFFVLFFLFHLAPVWIWLGNLIKSVMEYKNIEYAFTNKRIIIKSGVIGIDFKNIYYPEIDSVNLKVGIADKLLKVGDIYINSKNQATVLDDISDPYFITERLQKIVLDIKADIEFPNNFRPKENSGYDTKLDSKEFYDLNNHNNQKK